MKKILGVMFGVALIATVVLAADPTTFTSLKVTGTTELVGTVTTTGAITAGSMTVSGTVTVPPTAASWTNGQAVTATAPLYLVSGTGGANDTTNTVTLADPSVGQVLQIIVAAASTNLITIADSGNVAASGAILLDANDSVTLYGAATNLWVETAASDN